jgi:hypothetical protein
MHPEPCTKIIGDDEGVAATHGEGILGTALLEHGGPAGTLPGMRTVRYRVHTLTWMARLLATHPVPTNLCTLDVQERGVSR